MDITRIYGFPPIANPSASKLILGSMPGIASLQADQYYAHPQNAFWKIMGELTGAMPALVYAQRLQILQSAGIALWDVVGSCVRPSSLDAHIDKLSIVTNDFSSFFAQHPNIRQVFFNGAKAEQCFKKYVQNSLSITTLKLQRLPSTSPANAGMSYANKLAAWREALQISPPST
ncbi:MAG TPA: DNA-deoxyinosine glycosylase [Methylophilaceae bacterium]|nr:DNA-deoxyinosine glycosylase [Methylophilaceae bacterium]